MNKLQKIIVTSVLSATVLFTSSAMAFAAPAVTNTTNINNYYNNHQQVVLENVQAKIVSIQQMNFNLALNVTPTVNANVNINLDNIGPKPSR